MRWALLFLAALTAVLGGAATAGPTASAQQGGDGIQVDVDAGYDGRYLVGRRLPVRVSVRADRLVRGAVEVTGDELGGRWVLPLEVPGGSAKDVVVVIPTPGQFEIRSIVVRVVGAGDPVLVEAEVEALEAEQLVGLLPELGAGELPEPLALPMDAGTARFFDVDDATLAAAGALDPLGTLVAGPDELGRLDGASRAAILDWVDRGGRLVVDTTTGAAVAGLPDAWQPGPSGRAVAGLGEVRVTGGAAAAGRWADVIEPTPSVSLIESLRFGGFGFQQFESVASSVARDAGLSALDLPWLLGFLGIYVAIVGPLAWFLLRRRRPVLGWIAIPTAAVVFTAGAFVIGSDLRGGTRSAQGSIIETGPGGSRSTTIVGTVSRSGGDGRTRFPAGWTAGTVSDVFGFEIPEGGGNADDLTVTTGTEGAETEQALAAGGFGVVRGTGPVSLEGSLVVTAQSEGDSVIGTVRNDLPWTVNRAAVFLGRAAESLGTLEPGEEVEFRFTGIEAPNGDFFSAGEAEVWQEEIGMFGPPAVNSPVNLGLWNDALAAQGPNARMRGVVLAVGWTANYAPPVDAVGDDAPTGRSAVVARAPVAAAADGTIARGAARRELIRGVGGVDLPDDEGELARFNVEGLLWRFLVPDGTATSPLQLDIPSYVPRVDIWDGTSWTTLADRPADNPNFDPFAVDVGQTTSVLVPDGALIDGALWVRGWMVTDGPFTADGMGLELRTPPQRAT